MITETAGKKLRPARFSISFIIIFVIVSCSTDNGIVVTGNGTEMNGYLRFNECFDMHAADNGTAVVEFKKTGISGWEKIRTDDIRSIQKGDKTFIFIDSEKISGINCSGKKIPAAVLLQGKISVYSICSARYMSTMFSSKRMDVNIYLLSKNGESIYYAIPNEPDKFMKFSALHLSSCPELVTEIMNSDFKKKIKNPIPGNITDYEMADEDDIINFVKKYNSCGAKK